MAENGKMVETARHVKEGRDGIALVRNTKRRSGHDDGTGTNHNVRADHCGRMHLGKQTSLDTCYAATYNTIVSIQMHGYLSSNCHVADVSGMCWICGHRAIP